MESGRGPPPPDLTCPVCAELLKNAVEMPCCRCGATFAGLGNFSKIMFALQGWSLSDLRYQEVGQVEKTMLVAHHVYVSRGSRPN